MGDIEVTQADRDWALKTAGRHSAWASDHSTIIGRSPFSDEPVRIEERVAALKEIFPTLQSRAIGGGDVQVTIPDESLFNFWMKQAEAETQTPASNKR